MTATTECLCWGDPTSPALRGHDTWCPAVTGRPWCEDCQQSKCTCRTVYRWPDGTTHSEPYLDPAIYMPREAS